MNYKKTVLIVLCIYAGQLQGFEPWKTSKYFNTSFLRKYDHVAQTLIKDEGFQEVFFTTSDGLKLNGLFLKRPNATFNAICCAGFYPGRKEGLAPFLKLLPSDCNILFFDARGHGKSEGSLFFNLQKYGKNEYKDVLAALKFIQNKNSKPIIIRGVCAGGFHASRALIHLDSLGIPHNVKGLIFDSGLYSILQSANVLQLHIKEKILPQLLILLYKNDTRHSVKKRFLYKTSCALLSPLTNTIKWCYSHKLKHHEPITTILDKMHHIACPILFINSYDDSYIDIEKAKILASTAQNASYWWIEKPSVHACHHLKYKVEYRNTLLAFLDKTLHT